MASPATTKPLMGRMQDREYKWNDRYFAAVYCPHCNSLIWDEGDPRRATGPVPQSYTGRGRTEQEVRDNPVAEQFPCYNCGVPVISTFDTLSDVLVFV